jgi:cytochrome c-type biogenesis protein CcmH/NrfG
MEGKLRRAEQLAERKHFLEAGRILEALLAEDDSDPDVHAARAWVLYQQLAGQASMRVVHDAAARALRLDATHPRALYVRGLAYKRDKREAEALASFRRVLEYEPEHLEARREVRLARMRRRNK